VRAALVILTEDVKQKEVHIIVQSFVIQKQLCQVAKVLAVLLLLLAIHLHDVSRSITPASLVCVLWAYSVLKAGYGKTHLKHGYINAIADVAVDLISRGMLQLAFAQMPQHLTPRLKESKVELGKVQALQACEIGITPGPHHCRWPLAGLPLTVHKKQGAFLG
jgi:hypothetical protein